MNGEKESDFNVALDAQVRLLHNQGIPAPDLIVTDRDLALIKALTNSPWVMIPYLLCRWHVNMNVLAKGRRHFPGATKQGNQYQRHPSFKAYLKEWNVILNASTADFTKALDNSQMPGRHPKDAVTYAVTTWIKPWKVSNP